MSNLTQWVLCGVNVCKSGHCQSNLWQKHAEPHHWEPWPLTQNGFCWWRLDEERVRGLDLTNWVLMVMKNDIPKSNNLSRSVLSKQDRIDSSFSWFLVKAKAYFWFASQDQSLVISSCWRGNNLAPHLLEWEEALEHWHWVRLEILWNRGHRVLLSRRGRGVVTPNALLSVWYPSRVCRLEFKYFSHISHSFLNIFSAPSSSQDNHRHADVFWLPMRQNTRIWSALFHWKWSFIYLV